MSTQTLVREAQTWYRKLRWTPGTTRARKKPLSLMNGRNLYLCCSHCNSQGSFGAHISWSGAPVNQGATNSVPPHKLARVNVLGRRPMVNSNESCLCPTRAATSALGRQMTNEIDELCSRRPAFLPVPVFVAWTQVGWLCACLKSRLALPHLKWLLLHHLAAKTVYWQ